jgi:hypothetical protein
LPLVLIHPVISTPPCADSAARPLLLLLLLLRLLRAVQLLSCVCSILAIFISQLRELAHLLRTIANLFFYSLIGCMNAQINHEVDYRESLKGGAYVDGGPSAVAQVRLKDPRTHRSINRA